MEITPEMAGMPPVWSTYVTVDNAAATIAAATVAGGAVLQEPFDIPDGGKIAVIAGDDILIGAFGARRVRVVTHLDVTPSAGSRLVERLEHHLGR